MEKYELGVSFSGQQREYVRGVVAKLTADGFRVFFDEDRPEELLGEFLPSKLSELYGRRFNFAALFISKSYAQSPFCRAELEACVATNLLSKKAYLLPLRFDRSEIKPLNNMYGYVDISKMSPDECADLIASKIAWKLDTVRINGLIATDRFEEAERRLTSAYRTPGLLAKKDLSFVLYNLACTCSVIASRLAGKSDLQASNNYLDRAFTYYLNWFEGEKYKSVGWSADDAIKYTDNDSDLHFLRNKRASALSKLRVRLGFEQKVYRGIGGGGCVLDGTEIETPRGKVLSQQIALGEILFSLNCGANWELIPTRVIDIKRSLSVEWLQIEGLRCTPLQRLFEKSLGWIKARDLKPGMQLMTAASTYKSIANIERHKQQAFVSIFETNHSSHNFIASGFLCHNMKF